MTANAAPSAGRRAPMRQMVLWSVPLSVGVALTIAAIAWLMVDAAAGLSGLIGGLLSVGVFAAGLFAIRVVLIAPAALSMAGAFAILIGQLLFTAVVLALTLQWDDAHGVALAIAFIVAGLVFQIGALLGYFRSRQLRFAGATDTAESATPSASVADGNGQVDA